VADKPSAEVTIDEALVRHLLATQGAAIRDSAHLPLQRIAAGWDSEVWRLGDDLAVRLPRRALAAPLVRNEHRSLRLIGPAIEATGVRVPTPIVHGAPDERFPWAWSVVPWIHGARGIDVARDARAGWAESLAAALTALHTVAPHDHPVNPVRGRPFATRAEVFADRLGALTTSGAVDTGQGRALTDAWSDGLAVPDWARPPVWIHGDLHPGNLVADGTRLTGIIDFGDVTAGDPAYDLAVAWLAFDAGGRKRFLAATDGAHDRATWVRARAWAAAVAVLLLMHSDDAPDYAALGRSAVDEIVSGS
jgi:aminoglycoside phosphotransferase (APT) family kinase protein